MAVQPGVGYTFTASSQGTNFSIQTPWGAWASYVMTEEQCPFTINDQSIGGVYKFSCTPGMVDSIIPQIGIAADPTKRLDQLPVPTTTFNFDPTTNYSYIYLKVSADYSVTPTVFPVPTDTDILYPRIISTSIEQYATDDSAFFLLATAFKDPVTNAIRIWQVTCGSQWCDRVKLGTETARYYFSRV
jgi:hypothetical protein